MSSDNNARCDTCNALATSSARDLIRVPPTNPDMWEGWRTSDILKHGCDAHPAQSLSFDEFGRPFGAAPLKGGS